MPPRRVLTFAALLAAACAAAPAAGQTPAFDPRPSDRRLERPPLPPARPAPEAEVAPKLDTPDPDVPGAEVAPPQPVQPSADREALGFRLQAVRFAGAGAVPETALQALAAPLIGAWVTTDDLVALRLAATRLYVERGYVTSGVVLPDQRLRDGVVRYRVIEGTLGDIRVTGPDRIAPDYLTRRLRRGLETPLNVEDLRRQLRVLLRDPAIARLDVALVPGAGQGIADLEVAVEARPPLRLGLSVANDQSPSIGALSGELRATGRSVIATGDRFTIAVTGSEGLRAGEAGYAVPVASDDTTVFAAGELSTADLVEPPFDTLDIASRTRSLEIGVRRPFYRNPAHALSAGLALNYTRTETELLGRPFPFAEGVGPDGVSVVAPLRASLDYTFTGAERVLSLRATLSQGLGWLGATDNPGETPDGRYLAWLGQAGYAQRLNDDGLVLSADAALQLTPDRLLPVEQFAVGGFDSVRGYRANRFVRDNGFAGTLELEVPLVSLPVPGLSEGGVDGRLSAVPFADVGRSWDTGGNGDDWLASIGAGLRWRASPRIGLELYLAKPLIDHRAPGETALQDYGVHFRLSVGFE